MKVNLDKNELKRLEEAMRRVGNEISLHEETSSAKFEEFIEDLKLILCELWIILNSNKKRKKK